MHKILKDHKCGAQNEGFANELCCFSTKETFPRSNHRRQGPKLRKWTATGRFPCISSGSRKKLNSAAVLINLKIFMTTINMFPTPEVWKSRDMRPKCDAAPEIARTIANEIHCAPFPKHHLPRSYISLEQPAYRKRGLQISFPPSTQR